MSFPAQNRIIEQQPVQNMISAHSHSNVVKSKYQNLKSKSPIRMQLTRSYRPIHQQKYDMLKQQLLQLIQQSTETQNVDAQKYLPIILGSLEGTCGQIDPILILSELFGSNIENLKIQDMIKDLRVNHYSLQKKKEMSVRQISDNKILSSLADIYDVKEIKNHRKVCLGVKNFSKSLKKFRDSVQKMGDEVINEQSEVYLNYIQFVQEEIAFNKLKIPVNTNQQDRMIDESEEKKADQNIVLQKVEITPLKEKEDNKKKNDTASTCKNELEVEADKNEKSKPTKARRSKEEIEKDKQAKLREKEEKARLNEEKEKKKAAELQEKERERLQKQKLKETEREAKEKENERKRLQKQEKEKEKERQKELKQAERREKQRKSAPGISILKFLKPKSEKQHSTPIKNQQPEKQFEPNSTFLDAINKNNENLEECRSNIYYNKMKDQSSNFLPYFANIFTHRSRLEFNNFLITEQRFREYTSPHQQAQAGKYDDSSVEYEDLCGDVCNEEISEISAEDEAESNSAIVPDSYLSGDELSSVDQQNQKVIVNIGQGGEWCFRSGQKPAEGYTMVCLFEDEGMPLCVNESQQTNEVTNSLKCELYRQIHGYYGAKEPLIRKLAQIADKTSKSYLDSIIRETTTKKGNQRLVKPEIIQFLNQQKDGFKQELQEVKRARDQQMIIQNKSKVTEREQQMERLILEEAGTYYIIDLLQFLRQRGHRMTKRDLSSFIDQRVGSQWDDIRRRMKKMQLKPITPFLNRKQKREKGEKSDQEGNHSCEMKE